MGTGALRKMVAMARTSLRAARPEEEGAAHQDCSQNFYITEIMVTARMPASHEWRVHVPSTWNQAALEDTSAR